MLTPAQVVPFLQNQDPLLRKLAVQYLTQAHDPSPATAEDAWRMIDRFGNGEEFAPHFALLPRLPQTEASLDRTLGAIPTEKDENRKNYLEETIVELPYGLLNRFRDRIEAAQGLSDELRQHTARRFELASVPPQDLWDQLMQLADQIQNDWSKTEDYDPRPPKQLIEALSRNPESAQFAIALLSDPSIKGFRQVFAVELLGQMRHKPAIDFIVSALVSDEESDFLLESCTDALIRIGGPKVVAAIQQRWNKMTLGFKLYACDVLSGVKLKEGEAALTECLLQETDQTIRTKIALALCDTAANDPRALEKLREIISTGRWELTMSDLDAEVVALFTMVGHHIPELPQWRAKLADTEGRKKKRVQAYDQLIKSNKSEIAAFRGKMSGEWEGDLPDWQSDEIAPPAPKPAPVKPIRRDAVKVGRNDPCPCGSGKKYKKCCGK